MRYRYRGGPKINYSKCKSCRKCYEVCPPDVFGYDKYEKKVSVLYPEDCWFCGSCLYECPVSGAIDLELPLACA